MVQKVVVVDGNNGIGEGVAMLMETNIGIAAIMYGLYWLISFYSPKLLADGLGLLTYLIAPLAIILCGFFLLMVLRYSISFEDLATQFACSVGISYLAIPVIRNMGWIGYGNAGKVIGYIVVFSLAIWIINTLMRHSKILKVTKVVGGIAIFGILLIPFLETVMNILSVAGWA